MGQMTLLELKQLGTKALGEVSDSPEFEAVELLCKALEIKKEYVYTQKSRLVTERENEIFQDLIKRRTAGEPLQYILGFWEFYSLNFDVGEGVLIPRPDTEILVDEALRAAKDMKSPKILDLCCGSGCVGIALAKSLKNSYVTAADFFEKPLFYTKRNAKKNQVSNIDVVKADVFDKNQQLGKFDLIVANPPYIKSSVIGELSAEVLHEPLEALDGGDDGLSFYRAICQNFSPMLNDKGALLVEIGFDQGAEVSELFKKYFQSVNCVTDLSGNDRVVTGINKY